MAIRFLALIAALLVAGYANGQDTASAASRNGFSLGEMMTFRAHYGFINAAEATMVLDNEIYFFNGHPVYRVDVYGNSTGFFDFITRIRDHWGSYIDTASMVPHYFFRNLQEGRYRKYESTSFDHEQDSATVLTFHKGTFEIKRNKSYAIPDNAQDLVSGYFHLRQIDFSIYKPGDTITVQAFLDDESYDFKIRMIGREKIRTRIGKRNALVFVPIMPDNKLFDGEESIKVWISDDELKLPLRVEAEMFIGSVAVDIKEYYQGSIK